jgi:uncharacterized protein (TIGR03435 family)
MNTLATATIAVMNSLLPAAVLAAVIWLTLLFATRMNAATRFTIWWAVLAAVLVLPVAPRIATVTRESLRLATIASARPLYPPTAGPISMIDVPALVTVQPRSNGHWPAGVAVVWTIVFLYRLRRVVRSYIHLRGLKRHASDFAASLPRSRRRARLLLSSDVASPIAVGFAPPAVILPASLPRQLSRAEMDHVLLHETAHLARWDDWTTLLARVLDAALALHPVAAWILRRIEIERELACDEWVVARTQSATCYARSLARLYELRFPDQKVLPERLLASGMFSHRSSLGDRVEKLLHLGRRVTARVSVARLAAACGLLLMLAASVSLLPGWIALAQTPRPAFDAASIKRTPPDGDSNGVTFAARPGGRLVVVNNPTSNLITNAYGIANYQLVGAPDWVSSERYDIQATGTATTRKDVMLMLQTLLADRFAMKARLETREMPAYILTVAKGGAKLRFLNPDDCVPRDFSGPNAELPANVCGNNLVNRDGWTATHISMRGVTGVLANVMRGPVIDRTGIKGTFDVRLRWSDDLAASDQPDAPPSLSTALRETLGLELKSGRGPVDVLVIEHIERPSSN